MAGNADGSWRPAARMSDVKEDEGFPVKIDDVDVVLFRLDGAIHALNDICPHALAHLSEGFVEGDEVECPLHEAIFHIPTGERRSGPDCDNVRTYEVKTEGDEIFVKL